MHEQLRAQYGDGDGTAGNNPQTAPAPQQAQSENENYSVSSREEGGHAEIDGQHGRLNEPSEDAENFGGRTRPAFATDQKRKQGKRSGPVPRLQTFAEDNE